jgi:hypothetical protein
VQAKNERLHGKPPQAMAESLPTKVIDEESAAHKRPEASNRAEVEGDSLQASIKTLLAMTSKH